MSGVPQFTWKKEARGLAIPELGSSSFIICELHTPTFCFIPCHSLDSNLLPEAMKNVSVGGVSAFLGNSVAAVSALSLK